MQDQALAPPGRGGLGSTGPLLISEYPLFAAQAEYLNKEEVRFDQTPAARHVGLRQETRRERAVALTVERESAEKRGVLQCKTRPSRLSHQNLAPQGWNPRQKTRMPLAPPHRRRRPDAEHVKELLFGPRVEVRELHLELKGVVGGQMAKRNEVVRQIIDRACGKAVLINALANSRPQRIFQPVTVPVKDSPLPSTRRQELYAASAVAVDLSLGIWLLLDIARLPKTQSPIDVRIAALDEHLPERRYNEHFIGVSDQGVLHAEVRYPSSHWNRASRNGSANPYPVANDNRHDN